MPMPPAAQSHFLASIDGIPGYWATKTGGETSSDVNRVFDGGSLHPETIAGRPTTDDVTLDRPFRPDRDRALVRSLREQIGSIRLTITIYDTDPLFGPVERTVFPDALLTAISDPEYDADSADAARFSLTFAPGRVV